jgi:methyl-accepting chemotaxis protein
MPLLARFSIPTRLLLGFGLPLLLFVAFVGWMWLSLDRIREHVEVELAGQVDLALTAKNMERDIIQIQQWLSDISATRALDGLDDGFDEAARSRTSFLAGYEQLNAHVGRTGNPKDVQALAELRTAFDRYYNAGVSMAKAYIEGGPALGNPQMAPFDQASAALQERMQTWLVYANEQMEESIGFVATETRP